MEGNMVVRNINEYVACVNIIIQIMLGVFKVWPPCPVL